MLVVGLIDIEHMQSVIKVFLFQNCYYFSDLEIATNSDLETSDRKIPS